MKMLWHYFLYVLKRGRKPRPVWAVMQDGAFVHWSVSKRGAQDWIANKMTTPGLLCRIECQEEPEK